MIRLAISFLTSYMLLTAVSKKQKKQVPSIRWEIAGTLPAASGQEKSLGVAGPISGVYNNALIIAGGANFPDSMPWLGGKKKYYDEVFVYWKIGREVELISKSFKLTSSIGYAACCSTPKGVVYVGGENQNGISNKAGLLQWDESAASLIIKNLPDFPLAVTNASATVNGDMVYVAGGETATVASDQFYRLDLANTAEGWVRMPVLPKPASHAVLAAQSNGDHTCIYMVGGRKKNPGRTSDFYSSVYEFDLKENRWKEKGSLPYDLCAGTVITVGLHHLLLFGGDRGETFHQTEVLMAAIQSEKDEMRKQQLVQQKTVLQSSHPGFSREVLSFNTLTNSWEKAGCIPFETPVTTQAIKWGDDVIIPSGEIRAGVRTPNILLGRLLFK
jgi:cyclically-permuted mutarotase family protein